jgi:hypothetical protein
MSLSQDFINSTLSNIQTLHGRFGNELCNILKRHTGNLDDYYKLVSVNNITSKVIDILYDYDPVGNSIINDATNNLTEEEMMSLINYVYKVLNKYSSNIYVPTDPNIYL